MPIKFVGSGSVNMQEVDVTESKIKIGGTYYDLSTYLQSLPSLDADLIAIAALSTTSFGRSLLELADAAAGQTALDLVPGTDVQAYSAALAAYPDPTANDADSLGVSGTGWSDLFLASGAVIDFNAGDVTLTHASNVLTGTGGRLDWNHTAAAAKFTNTADAATNVALILESDRATPAQWDSVAMDFYLSDSAGNQDLLGRIACTTPDITNGSEDGRIDFSTKVNGTLARRMSILGSAIFPTTHDSQQLGITYARWSDLFLADGAVVSFGAASTDDVTITHSSNLLTGAGGSFAFGDGALATNATAGFLYVPTCAGTPTGTPGTVTGYAPIIVDTTNNKLYFYSGGSWRDAGP